MQKQLFTLFLLLMSCSTYLSAQDFSALESIEFNQKEAYKDHESKVLECANYLLSVPAEASNTNRKIALALLTKWMTGTPDYKFEIDESMAKLMDKNEEVLGLGLASMAKFVLENNDKATNTQEVKLNSYLLLLTYCENSTNKIKQTKELKKAIAAKKNGKLKEYLNI